MRHKCIQDQTYEIVSNNDVNFINEWWCNTINGIWIHTYIRDGQWWQTIKKMKSKTIQSSKSNKDIMINHSMLYTMIIPSCKHTSILSQIHLSWFIQQDTKWIIKYLLNLKDHHL